MSGWRSENRDLFGRATQDARKVCLLGGIERRSRPRRTREMPGESKQVIRRFFGPTGSPRSVESQPVFGGVVWIPCYPVFPAPFVTHPIGCGNITMPVFTFIL